MSEESPKPVNVDPRCIQEALRMYLQPIKNDDPQLDFYTMYKRETVEYDTEYMQKYNEDLNTTLIFAGLFSAVSSAFVIDVQSKLEPDPTERSEAYLRAILLTLNRSATLGEDPTGPPAWNGPPVEIIATSDLLYASLLMSLLAAFVAMLGKQWLNRYLRHAGGSAVERCGDRQRKFDGLEKWPFRLFIESLPIMLQIALLLLACGLSRYMWSVNTSVACVIISFAVLGLLFYIGIVVAGTWSYECPFQTPASMTLRYLRDSGTTQKLLTSLSLPTITSLVHATRKNTRKLLVNLSLPNATSLIYATWMDARQGLVSASRRAHDIARYPLSWEISLSQIASGIHSTATRVGHRTIILLLRIDRAFGNAKQKLVQGIRGSGRAGLLPTAINDTHCQPLTLRNSPGLLVYVRNLEKIRRQNADNARCVCWVLRNITDPEAIDSAIRLAGTIRWFDGDSDLDPPFDFIVSAFKSCFDSTMQLYPGMRDRAYFSGRAILQINMGVGSQSHGRASMYPVPMAPWTSFQHTDPDLHDVLSMLNRNWGPGRRTLNFPRNTNSRTHSLWVSNLLVDATRVGPNPTLISYESYLSAAVTDHRPAIANTLLAWYMFLGGHVEEETFWAIDKSDSLGIIFRHLSIRVMDIILDGNRLQHLYYLLEFLAAWEKRPEYLPQLAYQWCCAISEVAGRLGEREIPIIQPRPSQHELESTLERVVEDGPWLRFETAFETALRLGFGLGVGFGLRLGRQGLALGEGPGTLSSTVEAEFSEAGLSCDPFRLGDASIHTPGTPLEGLTLLDYAHLLSMTLEVGFRLAAPGSDRLGVSVDHTPRHNWVFETAFSSDDDEVIADAICAWIADGGWNLAGPWVRYFTRRVERDAPFSQRLRRVSIYAIEDTWSGQFMGLESETVRLLERLNVDVDDMGKEHKWVELLVDVICPVVGPERLSSHYWCLLDKLALSGTLDVDTCFETFGTEVARSLEESEDWEKLETCMAIVWRSLSQSPLVEDAELIEDAGSMENAELMEDAEPMVDVEPMEDVGSAEDFGSMEGADWMENIERLTLRLLLQRPSALPRFKDIWETGMLDPESETGLRRICDQARAEKSPSKSLPRSIHTQLLVPLCFAGDDTF